MRLDYFQLPQSPSLRISSDIPMETTLVAVEGKGTNPKTTLYVGGLEETVNEASLHAAFIPFGDIKDVNIPLDHASGKHRG
jgi:peptidyl-prolyl isomerase E (cyclophilin E)